MYFRLMGKLNARRNELNQDSEKGFTLIELLVVVIIIGILAAIAIPVYLGVQNNAKNSNTQSDVSNLKTAVVSLQTNSGSIPGASVAWTSLTSATPAQTTDWSGAGMTFSDNTKSIAYQYVDATHFCVAGVSKGTGVFYATEAGGVTSTMPTECKAVS